MPSIRHLGTRSALLGLLAVALWGGTEAAAATRPVSVHHALTLCRRLPGTYHLTVMGYFVKRPHIEGELNGALADKLSTLPTDSQLTTNPWPPPNTLYVSVGIRILLRHHGPIPDRQLVRVQGVLDCSAFILEATRYPWLVKHALE